MSAPSSLGDCRSVVTAYWPQRHTNPSIARPIIKRAIALRRLTKLSEQAPGGYR